MKKIYTLLFALMMFSSFAILAQAQRKSVSGAEITGTFVSRFKGDFKDSASEIMIQALGGGKFRIGMNLIYPYTDGTGNLTANMGTLDGTGKITGDTGIYESGEFGYCKITVKFVKPGQIKVSQEEKEDGCGFGHKVTANGTFTRVSGKKPKF
jgi:hypothetical protein